MNKFKKKFIVLFCLLFLGLFVAGCGNQIENIQEKSQIHTESTQNPFVFSAQINLDRQVLESLLTRENNGNIYKLIPATDSNKDLKYWKDLVVFGDEKYVGSYFLDRKLRTENQAKSRYEKIMTAMWQQKPPDTQFYIILLNEEFAGIIDATELTSDYNAKIGYITAQHQVSKGVATNALHIVVELLKYLKCNNFYSIPNISLWIFDDNAASITVAKKNGFVYAELDIENKRSRYILNL